jgi:ABC-type antimicrobial peptide transport system permease subunit
MKGVALGLVIGTPVALVAGRVVAPYLYGIAPNDPLVFVGVGLSLMIVTAVASAIPAWSAARLNPAVVLRSD